MVGHFIFFILLKEWETGQTIFFFSVAAVISPTTVNTGTCVG